MRVEPVYAEIGTLLMCHRHSEGLSQDDAAHVLGLSRASIANIEVGRQRIMLHTLVMIAALLKVEPGKLLSDALARAAKKRGRRTRLAAADTEQDTGGERGNL